MGMGKKYFSIFELILLTLFSSLLIVLKIALRLPVKLPGHSGMFWMAVYIIAAGVVPKRGACSLVGVSSGILAAFLGLGDFGPLNTFLSYLTVGIFVDLVHGLLGNPEILLPAILMGMFGHFGKFLIKWFLGIMTGAPVGVLALGMVYSLFSYLVFGAIGGALGCFTLRALRKAGFFIYLSERRSA